MKILLLLVAPTALVYFIVWALVRIASKPTPDIPQARIIHIIERMIRFPYPTVCRHLVAADLLSLLEEYGRPVSAELARAIVQADDDTALVLLARESGKCTIKGEVQ